MARTNESRVSIWDSCHEDILFHIFDELDNDSILQCFDVNTHWRQVVDRYAQHYQKWKDLAKKILDENAWNDKNIKCSGTMDYRQWCINARLWQYIHLADIKLKFDAKTFHSIKAVLVYKDELLLTYSRKLIRKSFSIKNTFDDMEEATSSQVLLFLSDIAFAPDETENAWNSFSGDPKTFMGFDGDYIYVIDKSGNLVYFSADLGSIRILARYYGSPCLIRHIYVQNAVAYVLLDNLTVMQSNFLQFHAMNINIIRNDENETDFAKTYPKICNQMIILHDGETKCLVMPSIIDHKESQESYQLHMIRIPDISCVTQLTNLLFVGYTTGAVHIYKLNGTNEVKELFFKIQDYDVTVDPIPAIVSIDVHEDINCQYLYVATETKLLKFLISYPEHVINNAMHSISTKEA